MLLEIAHYLTTPAPRALRRLGHVRESVSLMARSRRCRKAWAPHLAASRAVVAESIADLPRARIAVVLGSGLLDDVPLRALAERFDEVRLVDAVHPWPTRLAVRRLRNVRLVHAELSGALGVIEGRADHVSDPLANLCGGAEVDFVLSANLTSQLPILPIDHFESRGGKPPEGLGREIVSGHLKGLARLSARTCLILDTDEREIDRDGRVVERIDLLHGLALPEPDRRWDWELAPFGEAFRDRRIAHAVHAYRDWGRLGGQI